MRPQSERPFFKLPDRLTPRMILLGLAALLAPCYCVGALLILLLLRQPTSNPSRPTAPPITFTAASEASATPYPSITPFAIPTLVATLPTVEALLPTPTQLILNPGIGTPGDNGGTPSDFTTPGVFINATFTPYGQMPLCADFNGSTNLIIRANVPSGTAGSARVYCRVISDQYQIGVASVLQRGVLAAVDVFALNGGSSVTRFNNAIQVCLQGAGVFIFLDANQSPRSPAVLPSTSENGYQCASVPNAGTVVLTSR